MRLAKEPKRIIITLASGLDEEAVLGALEELAEEGSIGEFDVQTEEVK